MRVPSTEVQNNFGQYLKFAEAGEEIIVTKNGKDAAKILPCRPDADRNGKVAAEYRGTPRLGRGSAVSLHQTEGPRH